jgi:mannose-6-phosphate isomerase-like protein (cupin superfamily)
MTRLIRVSETEKVTRGEGTEYVIDNYITSIISTNASFAISHLNGKHLPTKNLKSDRIYYLLKGAAKFEFEDGNEIYVKQGDALIIPAGIGYTMEGKFDSVLVNSPPFDPTFEQDIDF